MEPRSNKAKRDKGSILADVTNVLAILYPAMQKMPKIDRIEGAPRELKTACYGIIRHYNIAKENPEARLSKKYHLHLKTNNHDKRRNQTGAGSPVSANHRFARTA